MSHVETLAAKLVALPGHSSDLQTAGLKSLNLAEWDGATSC